MKTYKTFYIGNQLACAEYIYFDPHYELMGIMCESSRVTDELFTFSLLRNIPILKTDNEHTLESYIEKMKSDIIYIMCAYGKRVRMEKLPGIQMYNIHYAILPHYKGRNPTYWATVKNEKWLGISIHAVCENLDEGDIIGQERIPYYLWENEATAFHKLIGKIPLLLDHLYHYFEKGTIFRENQIGEYYRVVTEEDTYLNLETDTPDLLFNKVRSQAKYGGAKIKLDTHLFLLKNILFREETLTASYEIKDNTLLISYKDGLCIVCTDYTEHTL